MDQQQLAPHIVQRAIAFEELRILYVPVPKASCTAILWSLAELAGLEGDQFTDSMGREVSRSLTIHDLGRWPESFRFGELPPEKIDEIMTAEDWLKFTVVRHPFRRLWSAWQSKILMAEPQFVEKFSEEPWYPHSVNSAVDVLKMFREFLHALKENEELVRADVHWAPQVDLIGHGTVSYDHLGKVEQLGETIAKVREHVREVNGSELPDLPRANVTPLPYVDELFDESDVEILGEVYSRDMLEFGYNPPPAEKLGSPCPPEWMASVDAVAPALEELRQRNQRVGDLQGLLKGKREELNARIKQLRSRVDDQRGRLEDQKKRMADQRRRNENLAKLRKEERARNERLVNRLHRATTDLQKLRASASWRYTAPLRRLTGLFGRGKKRGGAAKQMKGQENQ